MVKNLIQPAHEHHFLEEKLSKKKIIQLCWSTTWISAFLKNNYLHCTDGKIPWKIL